jgi:trk/ktr system potassium uptake protein
MRAQGKPGILVRLPLFLLIWAAFSVSMFIPAAYGLIQGDLESAQSFFFAGAGGVVAITLIALARGAKAPQYGTLGQLLALLGTFSLLPVYLAVPFHDVLQTTSFYNVYFDMISSITTTGANLFDDPTRLNNTLHLWRAQVGWMGGLLMWIAASAILAPLSLGGFEVTARGQPGRSAGGSTRTEGYEPRLRLLRITGTLAPVYIALTVIMWLLLMTAGEKSLIGLSHAMSVMATSGISSAGGMQNGFAGQTGEIILFLFMFFALSRLTFSNDTATTGFGRLDRDPEFRLGLLLVLGVPILLFIRHWLASFEFDTAENMSLALHAFWGSMFTVMSFLTTTGFVSADWAEAQQWSGLGTPGLILMGLALIGGGVATTAGGVKLLRVYALYLNGYREIERLVHPSSVSGAIGGYKRIQRNGAFTAWIFFMLFALSLALVSVVLAALGVSFDQAIVLSVATLSTTGPLIEVAAETPIRLAELGGWTKGVLCAAMILGRLETLAIIALLTPDLWRR